MKGVHRLKCNVTCMPVTNLLYKMTSERQSECAQNEVQLIEKAVA